jgi:hypothetical protein
MFQQENYNKQLVRRTPANACSRCGLTKSKRRLPISCWRKSSTARLRYEQYQRYPEMRSDETAARGKHPALVIQETFVIRGVRRVRCIAKSPGGRDKVSTVPRYLLDLNLTMDTARRAAQERAPSMAS